MELLVLTRQSLFSSDGSSCPRIAANPNVFFAICTKTDSVSLSLYKNYAQVQTLQDKYAAGALSGHEISKFIIPLDTVDFSKLDFGSIIKKSFGLVVDY